MGAAEGSKLDVVGGRRAQPGADSHVVVVAGTDTGVGKTFVSVALARALVASKRRVVAVKPVESGCMGADVEDGALLAAATGQAEPRHALVRLGDPLAPALAADREGITIDTGALVGEIRALGVRADVVLVEGAGGLLSPITWTEDITDIARALGGRVLLVAPSRLGVVHHVRSALRVLEGARLETLGVVLSTVAEDHSTASNVEALEHTAGGPSHIVVLPRSDGPEEAAVHLQPVLGWMKL